MKKNRIFSVGALYDGAGRFVEGAEVYVEDGIVARILAKSDDGEAARRYRRDRARARFTRIALPDGLVLPGLVNSHHHAYSALARGMPVGGAPAGFRGVLERLWWRLDRALDPEAVHLSGLVTAVACIRRGCTAVVDHHSSPSCARGSLEALADAFSTLSMTSVLCFETSDRNGPRALDESVEENLGFIERHRADGAARGMFGLHAGFTLSRPTLTRLAGIIPADVPIHAHVAEDPCDAEHARAEGFAGALDRLAKLGVLREGSLLAHGVHLADSEIDLVRNAGAYVAHNPESNCNNAVGYGDPGRLPEGRALLGTDGMGSDVLGAARFAFLEHRARGGRGEPFALVRAMLFDNPSAYLSALFGRPVGRIEEGRPADFAIFDYPAPTPLSAENLVGHLVHGFAPAPPASWVYARGVPVLEDGRITAVDEAAVLGAARTAALAVWKRCEEISP